MAKPIIFITDDDPVVLRILERDLTKRYKTKYRIMKILMKEELNVHEMLYDLKNKDLNIALFMADQHMLPDLTGIDFLAKAKEVFPISKKCLITSYDEITTAVTSINDIGLDYYFIKPWTPAKEKLYPILDDLLDAWHSENLTIKFEGIRVVGTKWSRGCHEIKDFLSRNQIPFLWQDIDTNIGLKIQLEKIDPLFRLPVVFFPEGDYLMTPTQQELAEKIGLQTKASQPFYELIVIGAGPAGLAAGVYGASEGLKTLIVDKEATGGQAGTSSRIENYLGFPTGISGAELAQKATIQAKRLGAEILLPHEVVQVKIKDPTNILKVVELKDGTELACFALIIATGVSVNKFTLPGIERFIGAGIFYGAALTEAQNYRGKEVLVLGGGNSAGQGAMFFSLHASKVKIIIRRDSLAETMSQYLIDQINETDNIELVTNTVITSVNGSNVLESVVIKNNVTNKTEELQSSALFIFIGARPFTQMVENLVQRDEGGYILTGFDLGPKEKINGWVLDRDPMTFETNIPGIFACGDVRFGSSKRVAAAVGEGSVAVRLVHEYLKTI